MTSTNNDDRHLSLTAREVDRDIAAVTAQQDIGGTMPPLQPAQVQVVEETGQSRRIEPDLIPGLTEAQTEARLHQRESGSACPSLGRASDRVECRRGQLPPGKPAEQLREPPQVHVARGLKEAPEDPQDPGFQTITGETEGKHRAVVRPNRTVVVGNRVVARALSPHRTNAPP